MDYDVAVVGGGPAGCAAALALRSVGYSTVVISAPNYRRKPTETAAPILARVVRSIGAPEALRACEPCYGIVSAWGRTNFAVQPSIINPLGHAWFVHRQRFDSCLQQAVHFAGATWIPRQAESIAFDSTGVSIRLMNETVRTSWLIMATGSTASAARFTSQKASDEDTLAVFWAHLTAPFEQRLLFIEPTDCGWWYLCPADGPGAMVCFVTDVSSSRGQHLRQPPAWNALFRTTKLFRQLKAETFADHVNASVTSVSALPRKHGHRWTAVGDAAMKLDPLGSSGILTALESGHRAGLAVANAFEGDSKCLQNYERWSNHLFEEFVRQRGFYYATEAYKHSSGFWLQRAA